MALFAHHLFGGLGMAHRILPVLALVTGAVAVGFQAGAKVPSGFSGPVAAWSGGAALHFVNGGETLMNAPAFEVLSIEAMVQDEPPFEELGVEEKPVSTTAPSGSVPPR